MTTPRSPRTEADPLVAAIADAFSKHDSEEWGEGPLADAIEEGLAARGYRIEAAAPRSGEGLREVRDVVVGLPCLGNHTGGTPCDRNVVWRTAVLEAIDAAIEAEAAAPRSGEGLDVETLARAWYAAVDEPEDGPWEHASDAAVDNAKAWAIAIAAKYAALAAAPREASEPLRNAGEVMRNGPSKATSLPDELPFSVAPREASEPPST